MRGKGKKPVEGKGNEEDGDVDVDVDGDVGKGRQAARKEENLDVGKSVEANGVTGGAPIARADRAAAKRKSDGEDRPGKKPKTVKGV